MKNAKIYIMYNCCGNVPGRSADHTEPSLHSVILIFWT